MPEGYVAATDTITTRKTGKSHVKDLKKNTTTTTLRK